MGILVEPESDESIVHSHSPEGPRSDDVREVRIRARES